MTVAAQGNYYHFFGINDSPFSIAPDPHYLFLGEKHQEALAHLFYGIGNEGGFIVLTGEVGTGKTTICRTILQQMPEDTDVAYIVNPRQDANELLESICDELGLFFDAEGRSNKVMLDIINKFLLASHSRGRHTLLIIDEAQNLSADVLEQIRLLTNLETNQKKLLQLVLIGQPELADMLASRELRQLSQRVTARYHLETLTRRETGNYIEHRLKVAGFHGTLFSAAALRRVYRATRGVPRLINVLCERCLLGAYVSESRCIDAGIVKRATRELKDPERKSRRFWRELGKLRLPKLALPLLAALVLGVSVNYVTRMQYLSSAYAVSSVVAEPVVIAAQNDVQDDGEDAGSGITAGEAVSVENPLAVVATPDRREAALRRLAARWNIAAPDDLPVCEAVADDGLSCLELELSPASIAQLGMPGVVESDVDGVRQYQVVETSAELQQAAGQEGAALRFLVFWRSPPLAARQWPWSMGDEHDGVHWLQQRLHWYRGNKHYWVSNTPPDASIAVRDRFDWMYSRSPVLLPRDVQSSFDLTMREDLRDLQQQLGWRATGEGDLLTLVKLDSITNTRAPSLAHSG